LRRFFSALGLTWQDVRFAKRTLRVRGQGVETTKRHRRVAPMGHALAGTLAEHRETVLDRGLTTLSSRAPSPRKPLSDCSVELLCDSAGRTLWYTISGAPSRVMCFGAVFLWLGFSGG
jgi:hypothetical protein